LDNGLSPETVAPAASEDVEPPGPAATIRLAAFHGEQTVLFTDLATRFEDPSHEHQLAVRKVAALSVPRARAFRKRFFPGASADDWNDWRWQLRHRIRDLATLERMLRLGEDERQALTFSGSALPVAVTPYYASLLDEHDPAQPLRRTMIPTTAELVHSPGEAEDPLQEESMSPVPGLVHRYPDRVLFLTTDFCSAYCRYCTRSRMVGQGSCSPADTARWERALDYIQATPQVRDVLLSGGDPLTLPDERLEWLLSRLRAIQHVEFVRLGTKVPAVLPQRITPKLTRMLKKYHPLWMSLHFTHPAELTPETALACNRLADAGIPLGSQTVLLQGINDDVPTLRSLYHGLLRLRVRPYYLYQCDPILGSAHFRTSVSRGIEMIQGLRGHPTGYAVPTYVIDAPGGGGKIPLLPEYLKGRSEEGLVLENFEGRTFHYPDGLGLPG